MSSVTLSSLFIYPVKSLGGIALTESVVEARGLRHDRRWMVVDADGKFLTQREYPRMALIMPQITAAALRLGAPGRESLSVPLETPKTGPMTVRVWRSACEAVPVGPEADVWLSDFLETQVRLVFMPDTTQRAVNSDYGRPEDIVSFADGYPLLLLGEASLADLNTRLASPVPMNRFRPNLVVAGSLPYAEDGWKRIAIGETVFRGAKSCDRCALTTIDQATAARGVEPMHTLAKYRITDGKVLLGQYLIPEESGMIRIGDGIKALAPAA